MLNCLKKSGRVIHHGCYWNPTRMVMNTRIGAFESDTGEFLFDAPDSGEARVKAQLIYRRVYKNIMDLKV
jgi:hypothetical protein